MKAIFAVIYNNYVLITHLDFGLSNVLGSDGLLSTQCGSPAYAAPEIFCNSSYGPAVDVWSM